MGGRPPKSVAVIQMEGRSQYSKKNLMLRSQSEDAVLSGEGMTARSDVRNNPEARKEFTRLKKLFGKIGKDDAIYSQAINDYSMLHSQLMERTKELHELQEKLEYIDSRKDEMELKEWFDMFDSMSSRKDKIESRMEHIRKEKRSIEDKNLMNIMSAVRASIPKQEPKKNPLMEALGG